MSTPESLVNSTLLTQGGSSFSGVTPDGTFENAVERGFSNTKSSFGSASEWLGARIGAESLEDWGEDYASRMMVEASLNPAELASYEDIDSLADVGSYIQEKVGENISILASMAGGAGVGALGAAGVRAAMGKTLLKKAASAQGKKALKRELTIKGGARAGGSGAVFPQLVGESASELKDAGVDLSETSTPLFVGLMNTALEVAPMEALLRFSFGGLNSRMAKDVVQAQMGQLEKTGALRKIMKNVGEAAKGGAKGAAKGAKFGFPLEGITEASQELVNMSARAFHDPTFDITSPEAVQRLEEAFIAGATVGGSLGATTGTLGAAAKGTLDKLAARPANPDIIENKDLDLDDGPADQSETAPDSPDNLAGQFAAVLDPESSRDSVLLVPGETAPFDDAQAEAQGFERVDLGGQGVLFTTNEKKAALAREKGESLSEPDLNGILFNGAGAQNKAQSTEVAVAKDKDGRVVAAIGFDNDSADPALAEAKRQVPGGTVERQSVKDVVDARRESAKDREGQAKTPEGAQAELTQDEDAEASEFLGGDPNAFVQSGNEQPVTWERPRKGESRGTMNEIRTAVARVAMALDGADPASPAQRDAFGYDEGTLEANESQPGVFAPELRNEGRRFAVPEVVKSKSQTEPDKVRNGERKELPRISSVRATGALPEQGFRSVEVNEGVITSLFDAAADGAANANKSSRVTMTAPDGKRIHFNTSRLVGVGHKLSGKSGTIQDLKPGERSDAAVAAVSFLNELGFQNRDGTIQELRSSVVAPRKREETDEDGVQPGNTLDQDRKARSDQQFGEGNTAFDTGYRTQNKLNDEDAIVGSVDNVEEAEIQGTDRDGSAAQGLESTDDQARRAAREASAGGSPVRPAGPVGERFPNVGEQASRKREQVDPLGGQEGGVVTGSGTSGSVPGKVQPAPSGATLAREPLAEAVERLRTATANTTVNAQAQRRGIRAADKLVDAWTRGLNVRGIKLGAIVNTDKTGGYSSETSTLYIGESLMAALDPQSEVSDEARTLAIEVLAHEVGHAVQHKMYENAPEALKQRIDAEYQEFLKRVQGFSDAASRRAERAPGVERESLLARRGRGEAKDYDVYFNEWFADQVARSILKEETTTETPSVTRFFAKVAEQVRRVYERIRTTSNVDPAPSIEEFLDNLRAQAGNRAQRGESIGDAAQLASEAEGLNKILRNIGFRGNVRLTDGGGVAHLRGRYTAALEQANRVLAEPQTNSRDEEANTAALQRRDKMRRRAEIAKRNLSILDALDAEKPMARVMFLRDHNGNVHPVVYLSPSLQGKVRDEAILHEAGHVALRQFMSNLSPKARKEIQAAFGADVSYETFEENFAHAFTQWSNSQAAFGELKGESVDANVRNTLRQHFQSLWQSMRQLWRQFKQRFSTDTTFTDFVEQIVNRKRVARGETPKQPTTEHGRKAARILAEENFAGASGFIKPELFPSEYLDMSVSEGATNPKAAENKFTRILRDQQQAMPAFGNALGQLYNRWLRPQESVWRNAYGMADVADTLRRRPVVGDSTSSRGDIFAEQRHVMGAWEGRLSRIIKAHSEVDTSTGNLWDRIPGIGNRKPSAELLEAFDELQADGPEKSELAKELRSIFNEIREYQLSQGVYVNKKENYVPRAASMDALQRQNGYSEFKRRVIEWSKTNEAREFWSDEYGEFLSPEVAEKYADELFSKFTTGEATMDQMTDTEGLQFTSPGFNNGKRRVLPDSLWQAFAQPWTDGQGVEFKHGFQEDNIAGLAVNYAKAASKRGVWQRRFGIDGEIARKITGHTGPGLLDSIVSQRESAQTPKQIRTAEIEIARFAHQFEKKWGVDPRDPSAGLKLRLIEATKSGKITAAEQDYAATTMIPQMQGVLNADFSIGGKPRAWARRANAAILVYQNTRVLALAPFAQMIDWALIYHQIPRQATIERNGQQLNARKDFRATFIRSALNSATRKELFEIAELLGAVQNDMTETVLNDEAGAMMGSQRLARANETFFRITGMHFLTNYQRAMAAHSSMRLIEQWAKEGNAKELAKLNITVDQAHAWVAAGKPKHFTEEHHAVLAGVHQFIDQGSLRPTPGMKPTAGNDQRLAILWHLNSFIYAYQQQVHGRIWNEMKAKYGEEEGLNRMKAALPALSLAAIALPMTAVAMQLRWLIDPPEDENRPEGWEWVWASVERSGLLGIASIIPAAVTADQYGKMAMLSPLGPTVGQVQDLFTDSFSNFASKAYPLQQPVNGLMDRFE